MSDINMSQSTPIMNRDYRLYRSTFSQISQACTTVFTMELEFRDIQTHTIFQTIFSASNFCKQLQTIHTSNYSGYWLKKYPIFEQVCWIQVLAVNNNNSNNLAMNSQTYLNVVVIFKTIQIKPTWKIRRILCKGIY